MEPTESERPDYAPHEHNIERRLSFSLECGYRLSVPSQVDSNEPLPLIFALHGMGMNSQLFMRVLRHLDVPNALLVCPEGIYPFEKRSPEGIKVGYGWYIYTGDQKSFYEHLLKSEEHLLRVLDEIEQDYAVDRSRTTLLGFSQGGYLAGFMAFRQPERFAALVIASSRLKHEFLEDEIQSATRPKTLFVHGSKDASVPVSVAQESAEILERAGAQADFIEHAGEHWLAPTALKDVKAWLEQEGLYA